MTAARPTMWGPPMPGHKCNKPTSNGTPCQHPVATPGATCGANHPKAEASAASAATDGPPASVAADPFAELTAGFETPDTHAMAAQAATDADAHLDAAAAAIGGQFPTPQHAWGAANHALTASMEMLAGGKGMPIDEQIARLEGSAHNLLFAAAAVRSTSAGGNATKADGKALNAALDDAMGATREHGALTVDPVNDNVRTARHAARKLAIDAMKSLNPKDPDATSAAAATKLSEAARWLTRGAALIKVRDNDLHQAKKLGAGGLGLPAIGSNEILETPEQAQDNAMAFHLDGAADGADDWLKGLED